MLSLDISLWNYQNMWVYLGQLIISSFQKYLLSSMYTMPNLTPGPRDAIANKITFPYIEVTETVAHININIPPKSF